MSFPTIGKTISKLSELERERLRMKSIYGEKIWTYTDAYPEGTKVSECRRQDERGVKMPGRKSVFFGS